MAMFEFKAMDQHGNTVHDSIEASSEDDARSQLLGQGYFITMLTATTSPESGVKESRPELRDRVISLMKDGKKIAAIKACRNETGMGLMEAKQYVETLADQFLPGHTRAGKPSGCASVLLLLALLLASLLLT